MLFRRALPAARQSLTHSFPIYEMGSGQWIGARNPVQIGSSCAAVTGYDFPWANRAPKAFGAGEGGEKGEAS